MSARAVLSSHLLSCMAVAIWLAATGVGMHVLASHAGTPGTPATPPATWPAGSRLGRESGRPTLVLVAHPRCPCTRASLWELARLMPRLAGRVAVRVLFVRPAGVESAWEETDLWSSAVDILGVQVLRDDAGMEARRFGAFTSGQVLLYGADGALVFSGGLTPSRGHMGDSAGRWAILTLVTGGAPAPSTAVFGCALFDPTVGGPAA